MMGTGRHNTGRTVRHETRVKDRLRPRPQQLINIIWLISLRYPETKPAWRAQRDRVRSYMPGASMKHSQRGMFLNLKVSRHRLAVGDDDRRLGPEMRTWDWSRAGRAGSRKGHFTWTSYAFPRTRTHVGF
jgi:hypothetical protein